MCVSICQGVIHSAINTHRPQIPHVSTVAEFGRDGVPTPYQLNDFWEQCRPWLAKEGVELYELVVPKVAWRPKCWRTPVVQAPLPAQLPFAVDTHALNTVPNEYNTMVCYCVQ